MARRRKSTTASANGKSKDTKSVKKNSLGLPNTNLQDDCKNTLKSDSPTEAVTSENEVSMSAAAAAENNDESQNKMMPLDIQQMILGDLQNGGQREEIIVSRESIVGNLEENTSGVADESGAVVESSREEEYVVHNEDDEEEEVIYMNEEDGEEGEGQYVIVVNSDDFEVTDETSQEIVSIANLADLQEGSCEIITVVRESDYESSQESLDGMDGEHCDNINAVIGTIDGIHCVKISQYNSDEESSNHENAYERDDIVVTEHEAEVVENLASSDVEMVQPSDTSTVPDQGGTPNTNSSESSSTNKDLHANSSHENDINPKTIVVVSGNLAHENEMEIKSKTNIIESETLTDQSSSKIPTETELKENDLEVVSDKAKKNKPAPKRKGRSSVKSKTAIDSVEVNCEKVNSDLNTATGSQRERRLGFSKPEDSKAVLKNRLPDSSNDDADVNVKEVDSKTTALNQSLKSGLGNKLKTLTENVCGTSDKSEKTVQEQEVTSNWTNSDVPSNKEFTNMTLVVSPKKENRRPNSSLLDSFYVQSVKLEDKTESAVKLEPAVKQEEEKPNAFRSRSGSTDTTSSESGSTSSSGRRRSGRIMSIVVSKSGDAVTVSTVTSTTMTPPVSDKPVKVKSRWRQSSELEMGSSVRRPHDSESGNGAALLRGAGRPSTPPNTPPSDKEGEGDSHMDFQRLTSNQYLTDRSKSKDAKRMVCDCVLTKEEMARGDMGCGEDCLNRLLMIECGARCMLGERCANKRFQNLEYANCEVFKTVKKGFGLRALEDIPTDTFLLEYVGEVLDPKEFRKRAKEYSKDKNLHFYFMALKSDSIIDATQKGNISRFINHSCDPNAETQKWTVNGELRIGFFSKRSIAAGEEITFDYQLQRYGKEAQRCYCETTQCRGWIGEDPEKENKWSDLSSGRSGRERREKDRRKKEDKRSSKDVLSDIDLEEEIDKLVLKNRAQTLLLCRLMVRAEDLSSRRQLLKVLQKGETACLRLFLDYHGLRLIWSWMMDPATISSLKLEILDTLAKLPIPNKTMLQDSKVLSVVEKWSTTALAVADAKDRSSTEEEFDKADTEKDKQSKNKDVDKNSDDSNSSKPLETEEQQEEHRSRLIELANSLLKDWSSLKEVYRIPKKERIEQMKEHEREADKVCRDSSAESQDRSYDRHRSQDKPRNDYDRRDRDRKRGRDSPDSDRCRKSSRTDDKNSQLTKMERRQLFAIKAAREEEERLRRQHEEQVWQEHVQIAAHELAAQQAAAAQQEANTFNNFQAYPPPQWPFPPPDGNIMPPQQMFGPMNHPNPPPPFMFNQPGPQMHQHPPFLEPNQHPPFLDPNQHPPFLEPNHSNPPFHNQVAPMFNHPPPLPKIPLLPTPNQPLLLTPPLPNQPRIATPNQPILLAPPLSNQPYQQSEILSNPPLPSQPYQGKEMITSHPPTMQVNLPSFTTQPPLPNQPQPVLIANQPTPVMPPQAQFSQPPPFTSQPPLPPTPNRQVFSSPLASTFQPPLPLRTPAPTAVVPVTSTVSPMPVYLATPVPLPLPPKWKTAKDAAGRTYYYHIKTRVSQWEPPLWEHREKRVVQESESESSSSDSEGDGVGDGDSSFSEDEDQDEVKVQEMEEEAEPVEPVDDDLGVDELGDSPYEPETMELMEDIMEDTRKKRKDILVQERIISPRTAEEMPEKLDKRKIRELKEKLKRQKAKEKLRQKQKNKLKSRSSTSKCEADTSSDPGRKIKDAFRLNMATVIVHHLNAYRKPDCKLGKITNTEDFKHLARKLTHFVMLKELKHCRSVDELTCNDNVKHKARDFIKKYMAKYGPVYQRLADDD